LEGNKKQNKTHWYYQVNFKDGSEDWLPYLEVRELQEALNEYLNDHQDFARRDRASQYDVIEKLFFVSLVKQE
jgi:hypothetical protein